MVISGKKENHFQGVTSTENSTKSEKNAKISEKVHKSEKSAKNN